jgi:hypothetical protein
MTNRGSKTFRRISCAAAILGAAAFPTAPAQACELSLAGKVLKLSGRILLGDQYVFRDFIQKLGDARIAAIRLESPGGSISAAAEIGRMVRAQKLTTVVDASSAACASSCTIIFVSGVERVYLNAPSGGGLLRQHGFRGLGFHQGSVHGAPFGPSYSGEGTAQMMALYQEFGVPNAASLVDKAPPEAIYGLSREQALALGIATRTSWP